MITEEEKSLFLSQVKDAQPLQQPNKTVLDRQKLQKKQAQKTIREVKKRQQLQTSHITLEPDFTASVSVVTSHEKIHFQQKGIPLQTLTQLKKGAFINQAQLDLHGYTSDEAKQKLISFVSAAYQKNQRYIRVIHGKGHHSEAHFPVIKNLVNQVLRGLPFILAFCSAPEREGGAGAVNILLKKQ